MKKVSVRTNKLCATWPNLEHGVSEADGAVNLLDPMPLLRTDYRVFTRGNKLVFGKRSFQGEKYSTQFSLVPPSTLDLLGPGVPQEYHEKTAGALSASIASKTKSTYSTALRMLERCQAEIQRPLSMPLSQQDVLVFVAYMQTRNVTEATINLYLSSLRLAMISSGYTCSTLRTPVVKQILKGVRNIKTDPRALAEKRSRRAMTTHHLLLLGHSISKSTIPSYMKSMIWAASLAAFWGSLRMGEILCSHSTL